MLFNERDMTGHERALSNAIEAIELNAAFLTAKAGELRSALIKLKSDGFQGQTEL